MSRLQSTGSIEDLFGELSGDEPSPVPPPKSKVKPKKVQAPIEEPVIVISAPPAAPPPVDVPPAKKHSGQCGPAMLDCGHSDWFGLARNEAARAEGFCCQGGKEKIVPNMRDMTGIYAKPLPINARRSRDSEKSGFPGYCCDDKGFYIGGATNDCRRHRPEGTKPCKAHRKAEPAPVVEEPEPPEEVVEDVLSTLGDLSPAPKMSFKQKQLELRKQKKGS